MKRRQRCSSLVPVLLAVRDNETLKSCIDSIIPFSGTTRSTGRTAGTRSTTTPPTDELFEILSNSRRRHLIYHLFEALPSPAGWTGAAVVVSIGLSVLVTLQYLDEQGRTSEVLSGYELLVDRRPGDIGVDRDTE